MWTNSWQTIFQVLSFLKCLKNSSRCFGKIKAPQNCPVSCGIPICHHYIHPPHVVFIFSQYAKYNKPVQVVTEELIKSVCSFALLLLKTCY